MNRKDVHVSHKLIRRMDSSTKKEEITKIDETERKVYSKIKLIGYDEAGEYDDLEKELKIDGSLGKGAFSKVFLAFDRTLGKEVACKVLPKSDYDWFFHSLNELEEELSILHYLPNHPNICQFYRHLEDYDYVYFIMEVCGKTSLREYLDKDEVLESEVKSIFIQFLEGMNALHNSHIYHLDLKPANLMLNDQGVVKIIDFGKSKVGDSFTTEYMGSAGYQSPESVDGVETRYSKLDVWYMGVSLYRFMYNEKPFGDRVDMIFERRVRNLNYTFPTSRETSSEFKDLVRHLLAYDIDRYSIKQIFNHPWIVSHS